MRVGHVVSYGVFLLFFLFKNDIYYYLKCFVGNHHLCRNPNGTYTGPWCYTDLSYHHTELCDIPKCGMYFYGPL